MRLIRWGCWVLFGVAFLLGAGRLHFDVEILNLLPRELPAANGLKLYQQHFAAARELLITVETPNAEASEAAAREIARVLRTRTDLVSGVVWQPSWLEGPRFAAELTAFIWLNQLPEEVSALDQRLAVTNLPRVLGETREALATSLSPGEIALRGYDPYGLLQLPESVTKLAMAPGGAGEPFSSSDGRFRVLFVEAAPDLSGYKACRSWLGDIRRIVEGAKASVDPNREAEIHFTGRPVFVTEIAGGMEGDLAGSSVGTLATIGLLFWLSHRRLRPLVWLLFLLVLILAGTMALGGLVLGSINVVSLGFAAMLLGLAEDFGIVAYQESRSHPNLSVTELRREVAPGILWSALTTSGAFLLLNLSVLPGLGQLGTLVAVGITLGALVMLYAYLPLLPRLRRKRRGDGASEGASGVDATDRPIRERFLLFPAHRTLPTTAARLLTGLILVGSICLLVRDGIRFDHSANVLRPKHSEAATTLKQIQDRFGGGKEPVWALISGKDEAEVAFRLREVEQALNTAVSNRLITSFTSPGPLWANPENQRGNRAALAALTGRRAAFQGAAQAGGFTPQSLGLTESVLGTWSEALATKGVYWPTNWANRWLLGKFAGQTTNGPLALVLIRPADDPGRAKEFLAGWPATAAGKHTILSGWELLGATVFDAVASDLPVVVVPILLLVLATLGLAFRRLAEVLWSLGTLAFSGLCLAGVMNLLHWEWNLLNLMAIPLLLGMGVDFSIHILLALRRHHGDVLAVHRSVGRALLLAGSTTVAGFGSLAFSSNAGMASLGQVCALGIFLALVTAVYLLPAWWRMMRRGKSLPSA